METDMTQKTARTHRTGGHTIDILNGPLVPGLAAFALPIALAGMLQQLFNFADTAVVGRFADASALAAVGTNGEIVALIVTLSAGLSVGVNVLIAAAIGRGDREKLPAMTTAAWLMALVIGLLLTGISLLLAEPVLRLIHTPENAYAQAVLYLRLYAMGCPALMVYDFGSAILRAKGDSRRPLLAMVLSGMVNLLLNLLFVIGCRMGVAGVALATDISTLLSSIMVFRWVMADPEAGVQDGEWHAGVAFHGAHAKDMLRIGLPAAIQGAVFCFANIFVQSAVNSFGTAAAAGAAAAMNFEYLTYYAITAFGQTAATFTGQNYAAGNRERSRKIGSYCVILSALCCGTMTVPLCLFRFQAAGLFSGDAEVVEAAALRMILILTFEPMCACYESLSGVLRGMGHSMLPAVETILGTCVLRIVWIQTVFRWEGTLSSLYAAFPVSWVITSAAVIGTWQWTRRHDEQLAYDADMSANAPA